MPSQKTEEMLLSAISTDSQSARWGDFFKIYTPVMEAYLASHFPGVPADDIVQETFLVLIRCLPNYRYDPDERGCFKNYLIGIVRHKAIHYLKLHAREKKEIEGYLVVRGGACAVSESDKAGEQLLQQFVYEQALQELLSDPSVREQTKNIFTSVAINGEKPDEVARRFGVSRNNVDQIKARMILRLRKISDQMLQEIGCASEDEK